MSTPAEVARKLSAVADIYTGDYTAVAHAVGRVSRAEVAKVARSVAGGDQRLSHMGRRGARLGMGYDVADRGRTMVVRLRPPGPWLVTERGAKPHQIGAGRGRARRRRPARFLHGAAYDHPVRGPIAHPGAAGKRAITRAFRMVADAAPRAAHEALVARVARIF